MAQKITPFLWFNDNAEEAMNFYVSVFSALGGAVLGGQESKVISTIPGPDGKVMGCSFQLAGQEFKALNGGPQHKFTEAISLFVNTETQEEIDELWEKLTNDGGSESQCGWLKDKFGLSWQIIPSVLGKFFSDPDREKASRAMQAMMGMKKIVIADLQKAFDGE